MPGFPKKLEHELIHCILAHHGELEYGSPKKPALIEALALNLADNADAKLETLTAVSYTHLDVYKRQAVGVFHGSGGDLFQRKIHSSGEY